MIRRTFVCRAKGCGGGCWIDADQIKSEVVLHDRCLNPMIELAPTKVTPL